jgi:hypothetical protein
VIKLNVGATSLCFLSSHLAAHEGGKFLVERNDSVREILAGTRIGNRRLDIGSQFHHCFVMGDMNYRLNVAQTAEGKHMVIDKATMEKAAIKEIQRQQWELVSATTRALDDPITRPAALKMLLDADELIASLKKEHLLVGFKEPCNGPSFHPTFKVHRWEQEKFVTTRIPSFCDRILYKSLPGFRRSIVGQMYESCPGFLSSDHKPVRAGFILTNTARAFTQLEHAGYVLIISNISVTLEGRMVDAKHLRSDIPDVYVKVLSDPPGVVAPYKPPKPLHAAHHLPQHQQLPSPAKQHDGRSLRTATKKNVTTHLFPEVLTAGIRCAGNHLKHCHLHLAAMDEDLLNPNDPLGSISV